MAAREAMPTGDPGQSVFDDPSFGDHVKACRLMAILLPDPRAGLLDPGLCEHVSQVFFQPGGARIAAQALIGPQQFTPRNVWRRAWLQEACASLPIPPHIGSQNETSQEHA